MIIRLQIWRFFSIFRLKFLLKKLRVLWTPSDDYWRTDMDGSLVNLQSAESMAQSRSTVVSLKFATRFALCAMQTDIKNKSTLW